MTGPTRLEDLLALPVWATDPLSAIERLGCDMMVVALDDDPTGTQTVSDVPVLTRWGPERLTSLLFGNEPLAFLLTNSRSLSERDAVSLAGSIGEALRAVVSAGSRRWAVVSRSDSTLRGHYPAEVDSLVAALGSADARILFAPYFGDGGRLTIDGVHHLRRGDTLTPVAETEFGRDPVFGYRSSDLLAWVGERTRSVPGARQREVRLLTLDRIRGEGPPAVSDALMSLAAGGVLITDAAHERDIEVVALGTLMAEVQGLPVVARTAASYVRARAGLPTVALLAEAEVATSGTGMIVVGSHVPRTTAQVRRLLQDPPVAVEALDVAVDALIEESATTRLKRLAGIAVAADAALAKGRIPVIVTSRAPVRASDPDGDLAISALVSESLVAIVRSIRRRPAWILAKGGITSSDIATRALAIGEARVAGQLLPGVPVWRSGPGSHWPGVPLVVFPGNVGGLDAVREAVIRLIGSTR